MKTETAPSVTVTHRCKARRLESCGSGEPVTQRDSRKVVSSVTAELNSPGSCEYSLAMNFPTKSPNRTDSDLLHGTAMKLLENGELAAMAEDRTHLGN